MDNLWAAYAGLNAHILIAVGWFAASARGFAPAPEVLRMLLAAPLVVTLLVYLGLKLRRRLG